MAQLQRSGAAKKDRAGVRKLKKLALAFARGDDCGVQLHNALVALGREADAKHFHGNPNECCVPGHFCMVLRELLGPRALPIRRSQKKLQLTGSNDIDPSRQCPDWYPSLRRVCRDLEQVGIETVMIHYDGYGDSGSVEWVDFYDVNNNAVKKENVPKYVRPDGKDLSMQAILEEFALSELSNREGGWENNDGAFGDLNVNVRTRTAELEHNARYTETDYASHEIDI